MTPSVTVFTPTYNKPGPLWQCAGSMFAQVREDWVWWIVLDDPDDATLRAARKIQACDPRVHLICERLDERGRWNVSRPGLLVNQYYPKVETPRIMWLADDDLLLPMAIHALGGAMDRNPTHSIVYGDCDRLIETDDGYFVDSPLPAREIFGGGNSHRWPGCRIDWGQVMHTKAAFLEIGHNPAPLHETAVATVDAHILDRMAETHTYYPVHETVMLHRSLKVSSRNVYAKLGKPG